MTSLFHFCSFPDVMMPAYSKNRWSCVFFIVYLSIELYFIMNLVEEACFFHNFWDVFESYWKYTRLEVFPVTHHRRLCPPLQLLAVVFDTFNDVEKMKFKSLLLHKRSAIDHAFQLLVSRQVCLFFFKLLLFVTCLSFFFNTVRCFLKLFLRFSVLHRDRWVCLWSSSMVWCVFTDHACLQETASSLTKLLTHQGLPCSGNCLPSTSQNENPFTLICFVSDLMVVCSVAACRTFISSMRSLALNGR